MRIGPGRAAREPHTLEITFEGKPLEAREGDTLASALMAAGEPAFGPDPVTGRARGLRWLDRNSEIAVSVEGRRGTFDPGRLALRDGMRIALASEPAETAPPGGGVEADILVIGAGPAGLIAATTAAGSGAQVILVDREPAAGGTLAWSGETLGRQDAPAWCAARVEELAAAGVRFMWETEVQAAETDTWRALRGDLGTIWSLRAKQAILATGAVARMPAFAGNDLPGVMTAAAMCRALAEWGVVPGRRLAVFGCTDEAAATAETLSAAGAEVVALVDTRPRTHGGDWPVHRRSVVRAAHGEGRLEAIEVEGQGGRHRIACDGLAVAGGWSPQIAPLMARVRPLWNPALGAWLVPPGTPPGVHPAGGAGGSLSTRAALKSGYFRARKALMALDRPALPVRLPAADDTMQVCANFWHAPGPGPAFVDFAGGVTLESLTGDARPEEHAAIAARYVADPRLT